MFRLIDIMIDIIFISINWKNYFDRSILVISMTVLMKMWALNRSSLSIEGVIWAGLSVFWNEIFLFHFQEYV